MRIFYLFPHTDDESLGPGSGASPPSATLWIRGLVDRTLGTAWPCPRGQETCANVYEKVVAGVC